MLKKLNLIIIGLNIPIPFFSYLLQDSVCWASNTRNLCEQYYLISISCFSVSIFFFLLSILEIKRGQPINDNLKKIFIVVSTILGIVSLIIMFLGK